MNKRLLQFLEAENITQTQLADTLDVAKASVSNILAGRNRPGYDFIESLMLHYPALNIEWLITGKGKMYNISDGSDESTKVSTLDKMQQTIVNQKKITRICIFFDDGTFQDIPV